jgi:serine/threonine-protein kinase
MPRRFGKYTLIRKIALGGMAEIFLALQKSMAGFEKLIVVKRILPHLAKDRAFIDLLLAEARIAATLNHPNVAHIYDVGESEGQFYIAMEHIHGEDLRSIVRQMKKVGETAFPLEHALAIVMGCCGGLAYAHERTNLDGQPMDIVHRDVSPQNILVTFTGDVKLVDFGIAKAGRGQMEDTGSGQLKGKVPYMSPEQAQGLVLDGRSDIFSLGIMLFELCTGKRLFRGANELETLKTIVEGEYPRPRALNPNLQPRLEEIILRSLEKDPAKRYQSARDMQADLEDYIRTEQLKVSPLSLGAWMQHLFGDKLTEQKKMLSEGKQLAEVIAAQVAAEEEAAAREAATRSGVRQKAPSRAPWIAVALLGLLAAAGAVIFAMTRPTVETGPGVLIVESEPPGAAISLDGSRREERTPATIRDLPLSHYSVTVSAEGYVAANEGVDLTSAAPEGTIRVVLARPSAAHFAVAQVTSTPPGAHILLDGADTGLVTPANVPEIEPGTEHSLVLSLDGWVAHTHTFLPSAGAVEQVTATLERTPLAPNEVLLVLTVDPPDARVELDATAFTTGSPYEIRTAARRYRLRAVRDGFRLWERNIEPTGGERTELAIDMERLPVPPAGGGGGGGGGGGSGGGGGGGPPPPSGPGMVTINATPWCEVSIDGRRIGETPIVNHSLPSGRHSVVCTNPEAGSRTVSIEVRPGETTRTRITL